MATSPSKRSPRDSFKVIITGATGFVGSHVVKACLARKEISDIVILSRRELSSDLNPGGGRTLKVIIHEDFSQYSDDLMKELNGAAACIWCIGGKVSDFPDYGTAKRVQYDYTVAFAEACERSIRPREESGQQEFRFVFCSGAFTERDQKKGLWWGDDTRKLKGVTEAKLLQIGHLNSHFKPFILRPGGILSENGSFLSAFIGLSNPLFVSANDLSAAIVEIALNGNERETLENADIIRIARRVNGNPAHVL